MTVVLIASGIAIVAGLAVIGYRMGPRPGGRAVTQRDQRLQSERVDEAWYRMNANPNLRSDHADVVASLSATAVRVARAMVADDTSLSATEALAEAVNHLDQLERETVGVSVGPIAPEIAIALVSVGVLDGSNLHNPEFKALTGDGIVANPGMIIRIAGVADLYAWPPDE